MATSSIVSSSRFPTTDEIKEAMEMAGASIEGAQYLAARVKDLAANSKFMNKSPELRDNIIAAVEKYAEYVQYKLTINAQTWSGQQVENAESNMQKNIDEATDDQIRRIRGKITDNIRLDYAVSEKGHFVRAYTADKGALNPKEVDAIDNVFNKWLKTKDYKIKEGYLYKVNDKTEENNRISEDVVKKLISDGGLKEYMAEKEGVNATMRTRDYPGEPKEARAKREVEAAVDKAATVRATEEPSVPEVPETPQAGAGAP